MTADDSPPPRPDDLVSEVMDRVAADETAAQAAAQAATRRPSETGKLALAVALGAVAIWLWVAPPAWVRPPSDPLPPTVTEASLKFTTYLAAERVFAFQRANGRLPATISDAGVDTTGLVILYTPLDASTFQLTVSWSGQTVSYMSTQPIEAFLGNAANVIQRGQ